MHQCYVRSCDEIIDAGKLMCFEHWRLVPEELQRAVYATWRARLHARTNAATLLATREYNAAKDAARDAVEEAIAS